MSQEKHEKRWILGVVALTLALGFLIFMTRPVIEQLPPPPTTRIVQAIEVQAESIHAHIEAYGTVKANQTIRVHPEVSGRVVQKSPKFVTGGFVSKEERLISIDPRDFETEVEKQAANVARAEFEFKQEQGRQVVALREWDLLDPTIQTSPLAQELALRNPHLKEKEAALRAAESQLNLAEINLERTEVFSPFDAIVIEKAVEIGQVITTSTQVARLVNTDSFYVQVNIPYDRLPWIHFPENAEDRGSPATITLDLGDSHQLNWNGRVCRLLGDVDPNGRMVRLLIKIYDPFGLNAPRDHKQPLLLGSYVNVDIQGPKLNDVYVIPRKALHHDREVWIITPENTLEIRPVTVALRRHDDVIIKEGLHNGDRLIVSSLAVALPGMLLAEESNQ